MTKQILIMLGLALLTASPLFAGPLGDAQCDPPAGCCNGNCGDNDCCHVCPHCRCRMVPCCQMGCEPKKTTEYKYGCKCKDICVPGVTPLCSKSCCEQSGDCGCGGHCLVRTVHQLTKRPVEKETCVKTCTVCWTCPSCGCKYGPSGTSTAPAAIPAAPSAAPAAPEPSIPAPRSAPLPPPPRVTELAPMPPQAGVR